MLLGQTASNRLVRLWVLSLLTLTLTSCGSEVSSPANTDDAASGEVSEEANQGDSQQIEDEDREAEEDGPEEIKPPTENQFEQTLKNLRYQYEPALGADVYFPAAGGQLPDGVGITLQLVFVDYDDYFLQLRVLKAPTGDFDIQALKLTSEFGNMDFLFSGSQLYDAYIYDELTYEIGEYALSSQEETYFMSLLESDESSWAFQGASETVESDFDRLTILGIGTVLRFKQGLDEGYEIPEGLAQPLM